MTERPEQQTPKARTTKPEPVEPAPARGNITPVQYGGDGWGDLPVQMRG